MSEPKLVQSLIALMDSTSLKVQCQAALALRNLASDEKYQLSIVATHGLPPLLRLLRSSCVLTTIDPTDEAASSR